MLRITALLASLALTIEAIQIQTQHPLMEEIRGFVSHEHSNGSQESG